MSDYKAEQDRFLDSLRDLAEFREAATKEELAGRVDRGIREIRRYKDVYEAVGGSDQKVREWVIAALKSSGKLPANYVDPEPSN